jgi:peptide subunit release factor 1 (eRF1)
MAADPTLAYVRCAVSMRRAMLVEALDLMDRDEDDLGVMLMRRDVETCGWVLEMIDNPLR